MKTKRIILAVSPTEHKKFKALAKRQDMSMSRLIRKLLLVMIVAGCGHTALPTKVGTCSQLADTVWECYYTDKTCKFEYPPNGGVRLLECK